MELMAAIKALEEADVDCLVSLYTDSTIFRKALLRVTSWKKNNGLQVQKTRVK